MKSPNEWNELSPTMTLPKSPTPLRRTRPPTPCRNARYFRIARVAACRFTIRRRVVATRNQSPIYLA